MRRKFHITGTDLQDALIFLQAAEGARLSGVMALGKARLWLAEGCVVRANVDPRWLLGLLLEGRAIGTWGWRRVPGRPDGKFCWPVSLVIISRKEKQNTPCISSPMGYTSATMKERKADMNTKTQGGSFRTKLSLSTAEEYLYRSQAGLPRTRSLKLEGEERNDRVNPVRSMEEMDAIMGEPKKNTPINWDFVK